MRHRGKGRIKADYWISNINDQTENTAEEQVRGAR